MERLKSNWKLVAYWFVAFSLINVYLVPKFVTHEVITNKRVIVGIGVSLVVSLLMGLVTPTKPKEEKK